MAGTERREELLAAETAAEWLHRLKSGGPEVHAAFARWLRESPRNVREILLATAYEHVLRHLRVHRPIDTHALREQSTLEAAFSRVPWRTDPPANPTRRASRLMTRLAEARSWLFERGRWKLAAALLLALTSLMAIALQIAGLP